jgi:hypothetical protein
MEVIEYKKADFFQFIFKNMNNIKYNPDKHHRRSIRLKDYDYSNAGAYFVTICTQNMECFFGEM